jgi:hypothetical protein
VEEHEIVAALEWSKNIFLHDVVERDNWSFYIQILAKLLENPPSHKTHFYILTKIGHWVTFDPSDLQGIQLKMFLIVDNGGYSKNDTRLQLTFPMYLNGSGNKE